jgi:zinc/manganese transport system ATP-binding protein
MTGLIRLSDVTITYDGRHPAVSRVAGRFAAGSMTAIAGPNGAGKSTLLKALVDELPLVSGTIERASLSRCDIGYLPQAAEIDRRFPMTVGDAVLLGAWRETGPFRRVQASIASKARSALNAVGLPDIEHRSVASLSAGQFQRVLFARLVLQDSSVILLDEPFAAVDTRTTRDLLAVVRNWHREGRTIVAVLHDLDQIRSYFPETLLLARELIAWGPTAVTLTLTNLNRAQMLAEQWEDGIASACSGQHAA